MRASRTFRAEQAGQWLARVRGSAMPTLLLLCAITLLVLLTACANVANLMLARASARSKEIATRLAIGSGRGRMIRQLTAESLLLALAGGVAGVGLTALVVRSLARFGLPLPVPVDLTIPIDARVLLFAAGLSFSAAIAFGVVPAFRSSRADLSRSLRSDRGEHGGLRRFGLRNTLVIAQIAISTSLVICSGLFLRSLVHLQNTDTGMNARNVLLAGFDPGLNHYSEDRTRQLLIEALTQVEAIPGVLSASIVNRLPLSFGANNTAVRVDFDAPNSEWTPTTVMAVGPRYFETLGIPLAGRDFSVEKSGEEIAVVNMELAETLFPDQDPIGRSFFYGPREVRIIGVVANTKANSVQEAEPRAIFYRPLLDASADTSGFGGFTLVVKAAPNAGPVSGAVIQRLRSIDANLVVEFIGSMESHVQESLFFPRVTSMLFGTAGLVGLFIAAIGIYGVVSFAVARRTREIGIRMALGARSAQVAGMVLGHGASLALIGIAIGMAGGMALAATAGSLIYGVSATDPLIFATVPVILLSVALFATAIPARRAARVDPNRTLRAE